MVKFSDGVWSTAPGVHIDWATEQVNSCATPTAIHSVAASKHIRHRGDTLNTPTISIDASSPAPDILLLSAYHWKSHVPTLQGPHYHLFPDLDLAHLTRTRQDNPHTSLDPTHLTLHTTTCSLQIDTRPNAFSIDFISHSNAHNPTSVTRHASPDLLLTQLGWRSVGYVKKNTTALNASASLAHPDKGERWVTMQFQLSVGEKIYGLGERFGPFVKNGQSVEMWNDDGGTSSDLAYKNVPFLLSSRGYGIFIPDPGRVSFEIQSERTTRINISTPTESLSAYLIHGPTPAAVLQNYALLTGRPALLPPWTFGLWLSTSFTTEYNESTVNEFLEGMAKRDIGVGVFHFDCFWQKGFHWCDYEFDRDYFPDAEGQLRRLKERGYRICVWINPYIAQESAIYDQGAKHGYFIKKTDGSVWQIDYWQAGMAIIDFTNPDACKWYQSKLDKLIDMGVDCFKTDFGERIPTGSTVYHNTSYSPHKMHNFYSYLYNKVTFELLERRLGKRKAVVFSRSATAGGQRFPLHWGGDPMSTFEAMAETLRGGLSLGVSGFGYWAHDIGGFEGKPDPGLYKRWFAFGALSSHSRLHGSGSYRVPWIIDPSGSSDPILRLFISLKLSLMPYLYHTAITTHMTGIPMMRPLFIEFPEDRGSWGIDEAYMLGENVYVAPVFSAGDRASGEENENEASVEVYVPPGDWFSILEGVFVSGPSWTTRVCSFGVLPVLLRPGRGVVMSGGAPVDFYFSEETGGWCLREMSAWKAPAEWKARGAEYDYTTRVTVLVNVSPSPLGRKGPEAAAAAALDFKLCIPDSRDDKLGQNAAELRVREVDGGKIRVEIVFGQLSGDWWVVKVGKKDGITQVRGSQGQTLLEV